MAFTDPQTVTIDSTPYTCNRVKSDGSKSIYQTSDTDLTLTLSHQQNKSRIRRMVRLDKRVVATDPLTAEQQYQNLGVYIVIDEPEYGFNDDDIADIVSGLEALVDGTFVAKLLGNQH